MYLHQQEEQCTQYTQTKLLAIVQYLKEYICHTVESSAADGDVTLFFCHKTGVFLQ